VQGPALFGLIKKSLALRIHHEGLREGGREGGRGGTLHPSREGHQLHSHPPSLPPSLPRSPVVLLDDDTMWALQDLVAALATESIER
jgi:hypothetical protein